MTRTPRELLTQWVTARADAAALEWYAGRREKLLANNTDRDFFITFGMIPRKFGRADLNLSNSELADADAARLGWSPADWSLDQAVRVLLLLTHGGTGEAFAARLNTLLQSAEVREAIAIYRGLGLYPNPELIEPIAGEGLRTNILALFEAVAHKSPFPREHFNQNRWNHMVVKAIFVGSYLAPIQGLDERADEDLAIILIDTARERRAAGRDISFEIWRCVGPFARQDMIADITHELIHGSQLGRKGAALALWAAPNGIGRNALNANAPDLAEQIDTGALSWAVLSEKAGHGLQQHFARPAPTDA